MNIHEYQAKKLLQQAGLPVPIGKMATTIDEAVNAASEIGGDVWAVKAQIHAGGRGKGGGIKIARDLDSVKSAATAILGMNLITPQTGPQGKIVRCVYIEQGSAIDKEFYLSLLIDRRRARLSFVASAAGGMAIEEIAAATPERIIKIAIDPATGVGQRHGRRLAVGLGLPANRARACFDLMQKLYQLYLDTDATLIEINPLILNNAGDLICLDAKMSFDDNALFRRKSIAELRDRDEESPRDIEANELGLSYISLDGDIGCMVNGAGLAMATMDIIKLQGGQPANFLDVGGGADRDKVRKAFRIILDDRQVKGILVNIFGGIMRCDVIAEGIIDAARSMSREVPLIVRLEGTNTELGKQILADSGLAITPASDLDDAAAKIVAATR